MKKRKNYIIKQIESSEASLYIKVHNVFFPLEVERIFQSFRGDLSEEKTTYARERTGYKN